jgi:hypothetical protein
MKRIIVTACCVLAMLVMANPAVADNRYRDFRGFEGYRERPFDRGRHYRHQHHRGRDYVYYGHWRSWDEWDRYLRQHPDLRRHGRYYYEGASLMFRSCPPDSNTCIFFSIGR